MRDTGGASGVERNPREKTKGSIKDGSLFWKDYVGGEPSSPTPQERRSADDLRGRGPSRSTTAGAQRVTEEGQGRAGSSAGGGGGLLN